MNIISSITHNLSVTTCGTNFEKIFQEGHQHKIIYRQILLEKILMVFYVYIHIIIT